MDDDHSVRMRAQLQRIPQEIFDMIWNDVFTAKPAIRRVRRPATTGRSFHHVPHLMHVNRGTRQKFAVSYYSNSVFIFPEPYDCFAWLGCVMPEYRKLLKDIRYVVSDLDVKNGRAAWVRSFWTHGVQLRVGKDVAECLRFQTTAQLMRELDSHPAAEEWEV